MSAVTREVSREVTVWRPNSNPARRIARLPNGRRAEDARSRGGLRLLGDQMVEQAPQVAAGRGVAIVVRRRRFADEYGCRRSKVARRLHIL